MDGGKTWNNVTNFTDLPANANFVTVEAGHSDINTAYVLANIGAGHAATAPRHFLDIDQLEPGTLRRRRSSGFALRR